MRNIDNTAGKRKKKLSFCVFYRYCHWAKLCQAWMRMAEGRWRCERCDRMTRNALWPGISHQHIKTLHLPEEMDSTILLRNGLFPRVKFIQECE